MVADGCRWLQMVADGCRWLQMVVGDCGLLVIVGWLGVGDGWLDVFLYITNNIIYSSQGRYIQVLFMFIILAR